jgi:hypothetical protein
MTPTPPGRRSSRFAGIRLDDVEEAEQQERADRARAIPPD